MTKSLCILLKFLLLSSSVALAERGREAAEGSEPEVKGPGVVHLIRQDTLEGWKVPSDRWSISGGVIAGDTKGEKLKKPEWLYTKQRYSDFILTAEVKLSDGPRANSGIYFRVKPFAFKRGKGGASYEAPSGYEYDVAMDAKNNGSLGDWYARPSLRITPDKEVMKKAYKVEDWNRMTIRAKGNRLEYWLNGEKIIDYVDEDPKRSTEGLIGLQIHDRLAMKVELRNASVLPLAKSK